MKMKQHHKSMILCALSCFGAIGASVATFIATRKSTDVLDNEDLELKDKLKIIIPKFIPTVLFIGCTVGSSVTGYKNQKRMAGAFLAVSSMFNSYRSEILKEKNGEELDKKCYGKAFKKHRKDLIGTKKPGLASDEYILVKDAYSGDIIQTTRYDIEKTKNILMTAYSDDADDNCGELNYNEYRWMFGFNWDPEYEEIGWSADNGTSFLNFKPLEYDAEHCVYVLSMYRAPRYLDNNYPPVPY